MWEKEESEQKQRTLWHLQRLSNGGTGPPVDLWDERFSTDEAHRVFDMAAVKRKKRRGSIDMMAARIILQGYLDAKPKA
jgi:putative transcription antitermination factor YqgF